LQGLKRFYVRAQARETEVRGIAILYDQAMQGLMEPIVVAMAGAFGPFPSATAAGPRRVEYGSGVVIDKNGHVITDVGIVDGCYAIVLPNLGRAERIAEDKSSGLALLRVHGTTKAAAIAPAEGNGEARRVTLIGVPDPQSQNGRGAAATAEAQIGSTDKIASLEPAPKPGFAGAAAVDAQGRLIGLAIVQAPQTAGPAATGPARPQFVSLETIRGFLQRNGISLAGARAASTSDAKAAVTRVICARK
jgi:hypothetical protein